MKFIVENGTGLSLANSFTTVEFAEEFAEENGLVWNTSLVLTPEEKSKKMQQALISSSRWVSISNVWKGQKTHGFQGLAFPRVFMFDTPDSLFPIEVRQATVLGAVRIYAGQVLSPDLSHGGEIKSIKAGPATIEYMNHAPGTTQYSEIDALLRSYAYVTSSGTFITTGIRK